MVDRKNHIVLSCEHGGNLIPEDFSEAFTHALDVLDTHRGYDPGALEAARYMKKLLGVRLFYLEISRLLIECNRSLDHPDLFSEYSKQLKDWEKDRLIRDVYLKYRNGVEKYIAKNVEKKNVIHLSIHSFTPIINNIERKVDIGLLFDESRPFESAVCQKLRSELEKIYPHMAIMMNMPYQGIDDGFTTYLRRQFPDDVYAGIELEFNQKYANSGEMKEIAGHVAEAFIA